MPRMLPNEKIWCPAGAHELELHQLAKCCKCDAIICPECATEAQWAAEACEKCLDQRVVELVAKETKLDALEYRLRYAVERRAA